MSDSNIEVALMGRSAVLSVCFPFNAVSGVISVRNGRFPQSYLVLNEDGKKSKFLKGFVADYNGSTIVIACEEAQTIATKIRAHNPNFPDPSPLS